MATGCHCFRQRSYDPEAKFVADDYILATSFNSLTANLFNIPKKEMALFFLLVRDTPMQSKDIVNQIAHEGRSWSEVAHNLGITPAMAGKLIASYGK